VIESVKKQLQDAVAQKAKLDARLNFLPVPLLEM
jgi:hypothetical protein